MRHGVDSRIMIVSWDMVPLVLVNHAGVWLKSIILMASRDAISSISMSRSTSSSISLIWGAFLRSDYYSYGDSSYHHAPMMPSTLLTAPMPPMYGYPEPNPHWQRDMTYPAVSYGRWVFRYDSPDQEPTRRNDTPPPRPGQLYDDDREVNVQPEREDSATSPNDRGRSRNREEDDDDYSRGRKRRRLRSRTISSHLMPRRRSGSRN